jgi:hypothetical protein
MHELLAACFWAIDRDSLLRVEDDDARSPLARDPGDEAMRAALDRRYVEHDAFYEWRAEEVPVSTLEPILCTEIDAVAAESYYNRAADSGSNHYEMPTHTQRSHWAYRPPALGKARE